MANLIIAAIYAFLAAVAVVGVGSYLLAQRAARRVAQLRPKHLPRLITRHRKPELPEEGADLLAYPQKLETLEARLAERHQVVQTQLQLLTSREAEVAAKPGREDIVEKYQQDRALLDNRAASMRRVLGLVWKTRACLLFRAHLAITARRRPALGALPDPADPKLDLRGAQQSFHSAAAAVKFYVETVRLRADALAGVRPQAPLSADIAELRTEVDAEQTRTQAAYAVLAEDMDRLCDHLTWLGDHYASHATLDSKGEANLTPDSSGLVDAVEKALAELNALSRSMDPVVADAAVAGLTDDIGKLEEAGLEADAEARAQLEVERLLQGGRDAPTDPV